jgi:hypothetical protein
MGTLPKEGTLYNHEIRNTLNKGGGKTDNKFWTYFLGNANINIWSFFKPYSFDSIKSPNEDEIRDMNCGLEPCQIGSYTELPAIMKGDMNGWEYIAPTGGEHSPFRSGDFRGYYADAKPMIHDLQVPAQVSKLQTQTISITAFNQLPDGKSVTLSDLELFKDCYPAVFMKMEERDNQERFVMGGSKVNEGFNVDVDVNTEFLEGTWRIYPFLTTGSIHYTIPNLSYGVIEVTSSNVTASMTAYRAEDGSRTIMYSVRVKNTSGEDVIINDNYVYIGYKVGEPVKGGQIEDGLIAKANSETIVYSASFDNIDDMLWINPVIWCTLNSGNLNAQTNIITQRPN